VVPSINSRPGGGARQPDALRADDGGINYSYDGGLYRSWFAIAASRKTPKSRSIWQLVRNRAERERCRSTQPAAQRRHLDQPETDRDAGWRKAAVGIANEGFWGIPVEPNTRYRASFYAKAEGFTGPIRIALVSNDGATVYASAQVRESRGVGKV